MKKVILLMCAAFFTAAFAACQRVSDEPAGGVALDPTTTATPPDDSDDSGLTADPVTDIIPAIDSDAPPWGYRPWELDSNVEGQVTYFAFNGERVLYEDIGRKHYEVEDVRDGRLAELMAAAKLFNQRYPNVQINFYAISGEPEGEGISYQQERENFRNQFGHYPDVWVVHDLVTDILNGTAADLSRFEGDRYYNTFNPTLMDMMNYNGMQAGLPSYVMPWAYPINISLAENNNIEVPPINWTMDQYVDFVSQADNDNFYGDIDASTRMITIASPTVAKQFNETGTIDFDTDEVKRMIDLLARASQTAVYPLYNAGRLSEATMNRYWWWDGMFFCKNALLVNNWGSWGLSYLGDPMSPYVVMADKWDVYPFPKINSDDTNSIGIVHDPVIIRNYSAEGGHTEENNTRLALTYAFVSFFLADDEAILARASAEYYDYDDERGTGVVRLTGLESLPVVTGQSFYNQLELWFEGPGYVRFKDPNITPGWHEVLRILNTGEFNAIDGRTAVIRLFETGERESAFDDWDNLDGYIDGVLMTDPGWPDQVKARLGELTERTNSRLERASQELYDALARFYGK